MKIAPPQVAVDLTDSNSTDFVTEASLEACRLDGVDLTGKIARSVGLNEAVLTKVVLSEARLEKLIGLDVIINNCDFSAAQCSEISLQRTAFKDGRMTGLDCSKGVFKDVTFTGCKLDIVNFRFAKLNRVKFIDCVMTDADFLGTEMSDVAFKSCLLERTEFAQCKLKSVDLRTSQLVGLKGWQYLKGATIDGLQLISSAPYLANELGIQVID